MIVTGKDITSDTRLIAEVCVIGTGAGGSAESGPIIRPDGQPHDWSMEYDPQGAEGRGRITIALDGKSRAMDLAAGHKESGATFDRFGILNCQAGGHYVEVYLDDMKYTSARVDMRNE